VIAKEGPMKDRRAERDREHREKRRAREAAERRLDELWEAWRRNHPSEEEEGKDRPHKGRHTYPPSARWWGRD
jgi:hypothetical protein